MPHDERVDAYIAAREPFARPILSWLRARVHAAVPGAGEAIKWGMPFFLLDGRPLANMAGFKAHVAFGFWKRDAAGAPTSEAAMGQFGRITTLADLPDEAAMEALIAAAAAAAPAAARPRAEPPLGTVPPELAEALAASPTAQAIFAAFPPGARREYCAWVGEAKRAETRLRRAAEAAGWIAEGKRRNWKYEAG
jgi:uncharacterized protein YdeI (YjbR/CyaY-like superfamily)